VLERLERLATAATAAVCLPAQHIARLDGALPELTQAFAAACRRGCSECTHARAPPYGTPARALPALTSPVPPPRRHGVVCDADSW
jgi:hypothetical protein